MNGDEQLFYFSKDKPRVAIKHRNPDSIFNLPHFYASFDKDGTRDFSLEAIKFKQLDNIGKRTFDRLIHIARTQHRLVFTGEDREIAILFLYNQYRRTPDFLSNTLSESTLESTLLEVLEGIREEIERLPSPHKERRQSELAAYSSDLTAKQRTFQAGKVATLKHDSIEILDILWKRGFALITPERPNHSFLIGSRPVLRLNHPDRSHLSDPSLELVLPIAHDLALISTGKADTSAVVKCNGRLVRYTNELVFKQSTEVAGRSNELLISICRTNG